jgi:hypothetical protein
MKKFEGCGFTTIVTNDKVKLEIPISDLVIAYEASPNNEDDYGNPSTVKRGKRKQFAEWVAKQMVSEANQYDGATYVHQMLDEIFELLFEGYEDGSEFIKEPEEDDGMKYKGKCCGTCYWCKQDEKTSPYCSEPRLQDKKYDFKQYIITKLAVCPEGYWRPKDYYEAK